VDLKRTESEIAQRKAAIAEQARLITERTRPERDRAERNRQDPAGSGVHLAVGEGIQTLKQAESEIHTKQGTQTCQGAVAGSAGVGKATVEIKGEHSLWRCFGRPEFYISLAAEERFGIISTPAGQGCPRGGEVDRGSGDEETVEEQEQSRFFASRLNRRTLQIWPTNPLSRASTQWWNTPMAK